MARAWLSQGLTDDLGNQRLYPETNGVWGYSEYRSGIQGQLTLGVEHLLIVRGCSRLAAGRAMYMPVRGKPHDGPLVPAGHFGSVRQLNAGAWRWYRALRPDDPAIPGA